MADLPDGDYEPIETDVRNRGWYRWEDRFARRGRKPDNLRSMLRFSHHTETIFAARASQDVALGGIRSSRHSLQTKVGDTEFEAEGRYNILVLVDAKRSAIAGFTAGWLNAGTSENVLTGRTSTAHSFKSVAHSSLATG